MKLPEPVEQRKINLDRLPASEKTLISLGCKIKKYSYFHYLIDGKFDWWPLMDKWRRISTNEKAHKLFEYLLQEIRKDKKSARETK